MKRTLIAAAVLATAAGSAHAYWPSHVSTHVSFQVSSNVDVDPGNPYLYNSTGVLENMAISGKVGLFGCVYVSSTAGAVINNTQAAALSNVTLNPNYQSYQRGAITTAVANEDKHVSQSLMTDTSTSTSASVQASAHEQDSQSSTLNASSGSASSDVGHKNTHSDSWNTNTSVTQDSSTSKGHAAVAGALYASGSANVSEHHWHYGNSHNGGSGQSVQGTVSLFGVAGATWDAASSSDKLHNQTTTTDNTTHQSWDSADTSWSQRQENMAKTHSSSYAFDSAYNAKTHATKSSSSTYDLHATDVVTRGAVTQYIDTRQAGVLTATTGANAANGVTGNLGVNIAEGIDNAQSNDVALAAVDVGNVFGNAQIFSSQSSSGSASVNNFKLNASIGDGSLSGVSGNVGVNVASGIGNVQNNSLAGAMSVKSPMDASSVAMVATDDTTQSAAAQVKGRFEGTAQLGANTLHGASGNIGVNIAGGVGNLQHNGLAIAAINSGH